ncbi:MAG: hypothetical protein ACE5EA_02705 [Nitrospirota bacterium]
MMIYEKGGGESYNKCYACGKRIYKDYHRPARTQRLMKEQNKKRKY